MGIMGDNNNARTQENIEPCGSEKLKKKKILNFLASQLFYNIISLAALVLSICSIFLTIYFQRENNKIAISLSEDISRNENIVCCIEEKTAYLRFPVIITMINQSNIVQPIERVDIELPDIKESYFKWNDIFDSSNEVLTFPVNVSPQSAYALKIYLTINLTDKVLQEICNLYNIENEVGSYSIGTMSEFEDKISDIVYSNNVSLKDILKTRYDIVFWLPNIEKEVPIMTYPFLYPK